jgi:hypothetical protein
MATAIDERVTVLMGQLPYANKTKGGVGGFEGLVRLALLETARDQRHLCAEAVLLVAGDSNNPWMIDRDAAQQAVLNADIPTRTTTREGGEWWR